MKAGDALGWHGKNGNNAACEGGAQKELDRRVVGKAGKISVTSPIGKGLLGKVVGDVAEIQAPNGIMNFEILEISR